MKKLKFRKYHAVLPIVAFFAIGTAALLSSRTPSSDAGTAYCIAAEATQNADAPSSVITGNKFTVKDIVGIGNTTGFELVASDVTFSATNATPSSFTKSWTGSQVDETFINYGDQEFTATGNPGDKIVIEVEGLVSTITGIGEIECSRSNTKLTLEKPTHTYEVANITIVAPPSSPESSNKQPTSNNTKTQTTQNNTSTDNAQDVTITDDAPEETDTTTENDSETMVDLSKKIIQIKVLDKDGEPLPNAYVTIDSKSGKRTDENGFVTFENIDDGEHILTVIAQNNTVTQKINTNELTGEGNVLGVTVNMPKPDNRGTYIRFALKTYPYVVGALLLAVTIIIVQHIRKRRFINHLKKDPAFAGKIPLSRLEKVRKHRRKTAISKNTYK